MTADKVCGKDSGTSLKRPAGGTFPLSVFRSAEPATHLLQVADELATNFGVLGTPHVLQDRLDPATRWLQRCRLPNPLRENQMPLRRTDVFPYCYRIDKEQSQTT